MENIYKSEFLDASWDGGQDFLFIKYFIATAHMSESQSRTNTNIITDIIRRKRVRKWLLDASDYAYVINNDQQKWLAEDINRIWLASGLQKLAIIFPLEYTANNALLSTIKTLEKGHKYGYFQIHCFDDMLEAFNWLNIEITSIKVLV